jgi:hypothetical protein
VDTKAIEELGDKDDSGSMTFSGTVTIYFQIAMAEFIDYK